MSEDEKNKYSKPFSHPRWHEPIGGEVIGFELMTEEESRKAHEDTIAIIERWGYKIKEKDQPVRERRYPAIPIRKKTGKEEFINGEDTTDKTLNDFWCWAFSNLIGNTERGKLAEFIVAMAFELTYGIGVPWDSYDLITRDGISLEVKSSAYIQSWAQKKLSQITFGIRPTHAWDSKENIYDPDVKRQADVYVFCLLAHKEQKTLNPLNLSQWEFYILSTDVLNREAANQKTISLSRIEKLGATKTDYAGLTEAVNQQYKSSKNTEL